MIINTAGDYTLRYTATDECGNESTVDRSLTVASPRTVLYTDGTFIINEAPADRAANEALHGAATNEYIPFNPNGATNSDKYVFSSETARPWNAVVGSIIAVEIGAPIKPISLAYWFYGCENCTSISLSGLDTSTATSTMSMFCGCSSLQNLDMSEFDTTNVVDIRAMFSDCSSFVTLDLSTFNTSQVEEMASVFMRCSNLQTIYATTSFVTTSVRNSGNMFGGCNALVGGAGTRWNQYFVDAERARIDNPPSAKGYFTAKA